MLRSCRSMRPSCLSCAPYLLETYSAFLQTFDRQIAASFPDAVCPSVLQNVVVLRLIQSHNSASRAPCQQGHLASCQGGNCVPLLHLVRYLLAVHRQMLLLHEQNFLLHDVLHQ
ncbi:MAG: hypothetical protein EBW68_05685 [Actinobacteria bacterium]|nr:hypothetical protein [Actinomycetota bacterium]